MVDRGKYNFDGHGSITRAMLYILHLAFFTLVMPFILTVLSWYLDRLLGLVAVEPGLFGWVIGWISILTGFPIMLWAEIDMYRYGGGGTPIPFYKPPQELVVDGIYGCTRNPMYLGTTIEYIGVGLIIGRPSIIIMSLCILAIALTLYKYHETPYLEKSFGARFEDYVAKTPLIIPRPGCIYRKLRRKLFS